MTQRLTQLEKTRLADERALRVYRARVRGQTFKAISTEFGVSTSWAKQMYERGLKVLRCKDDPLSELSTRVRNVLRDNQCGQTPEEISRWFASQQVNYVHSILNFGIGSRNELSHWLVQHGQPPLKEVNCWRVQHAQVRSPFNQTTKD
jgi:hypothetical protein